MCGTDIDRLSEDDLLSVEEEYKDILGLGFKALESLIHIFVYYYLLWIEHYTGRG